MPTFDRAGALALGLSAMCLASTAGASPSDTVINWQAYRADIPSLKGDTTCQYGDADCNVCVNDVRRTFSKFADAGRANQSYWMRFDDRYAPEGISGDKIREAFAWNGHVQSFVRVGIDLPGEALDWFIASHSSDGPNGYLYIVSRTSYYNTPGGVEYAYRTPLSNHPGGMQAIGHYVLLAHELTDEEKDENHAFYEVYDLSDPSHMRRSAQLQLVPGHSRVANVSGAALAGGGYVFASSYSSFDPDYVFYYAQDLETLAGLKPIGRATSRGIAENLSMITECGTGDLYAIGSTAAGQSGAFDGGGTYSTSDNFWVLYQLKQDAVGKPRFDMLSFTLKDRSRSCNARASGTVFVDKDGLMHVFCHEKQLDGLTDRIEAGSVNYDEYWIDKPAYIGGAPGAAPGNGIPVKQN